MADISTHPTGVEDARLAATERLSVQAGGATLTLDEYAERAEAVEQAATVDELDAAVEGLPEEATEPSHGRHRNWLVAVFGGTEQKGRWRLSSRLHIVALLGGVNLDLGAAETEAPESLITIVAVLGGVEVVAPPGIPVTISGFSLLGGKSDERAGGPPLPGAPLVHIRVFAVLGGVKVKGRAPRRNLIELIRSRRAAASS